MSDELVVDVARENLSPIFYRTPALAESYNLRNGEVRYAALVVECLRLATVETLSDEEKQSQLNQYRALLARDARIESLSRRRQRWADRSPVSAEFRDLDPESIAVHHLNSIRHRPEFRLVPVWFGTNRQALAIDESKGFSQKRDSVVHYGRCMVAVPENHRFGSVGSAWYKRFFVGDSPLVLKQLRPQSETVFLADLRKALGGSTEKTLLLYVHGFHVTFSEAAIRAAQIGADLNIDGATAFYSWPSKGALSGYADDVASIEAAEEMLANFISTVAKNSGAKQVHIIAHSMGNLGLVRALNRANTQAALQGVKFGQIFLAAPDVDVDLFKQLASIYPKISQRTTLYVSGKDKALEASYWLRDYQRAGYTPPVVAVDGIDTVEVENIDLSVLGHGYYAEAADVLHDMHDLMKHNDPPSRRSRLESSTTTEGKPYWIFKK